MIRTVPCALALLLAAANAAGCSAAPTAGASGPAAADEVKPVAPPEGMVGKWRLEVKDEKATRTSVYHFMKDGRVEIDTSLDTPDLKTTDLAKRAVTHVEKDRITVVDISRTGADGVEDIIPAERRRTRRYQVQVKDDVLSMSEVDEAGKRTPDAKPVVLKRVKD